MSRMRREAVMTPRPPSIRTKAETALAESFEQNRATMPGGDALRGQRARAFDVFHERGLPHRRSSYHKFRANPLQHRHGRHPRG